MRLEDYKHIQLEENKSISKRQKTELQQELIEVSTATQTSSIEDEFRNWLSKVNELASEGKYGTVQQMVNLFNHQKFNQTTLQQFSGLICDAFTDVDHGIFKFDFKLHKILMGNEHTKLFYRGDIGFPIREIIHQHFINSQYYEDDTIDSEQYAVFFEQYIIINIALIDIINEPDVYWHNSPELIKQKMHWYDSSKLFYGNTLLNVAALLCDSVALKLLFKYKARITPANDSHDMLDLAIGCYVVPKDTKNISYEINDSQRIKAVEVICQNVPQQIPNKLEFAVQNCSSAIVKILLQYIPSSVHRGSIEKCKDLTLVTLTDEEKKLVLLQEYCDKQDDISQMQQHESILPPEDISSLPDIKLDVSGNSGIE